MTAKTPDSPQESRPPSAASSTSSVPAQPAQPALPAGPAAATTTANLPAVVAKPPAKPPTKPPAKGTASRPTGKPRTGGLAYVVAVLAVLIAIGSTFVSIYALNVARQAKSRTADTAADRTPGPAPAATTAPARPTPTPTTPRVQFAPEIIRANLRIPPADGCASVFVDIDAMQVGVDNGHEFYLSNCLGTTAFRIDKTSGAAATQENPTPEVCVAQLAGLNTTTELVLQVRTGLTFCLLTNKDEATRQGIPQRVGIVEVRDIAADRSVTVAVSTYRVPS
jgi:hypothetical protein